MWFLGTDFTTNKREDYGPGVQGKEPPSAHLDASATPVPSAGAVPPSPPSAALGASCAAAFPSAASVTSASATSASSAHLPVSAPHGTGLIATASAAQEVMVSTVMQVPVLGKGLQTCLYGGYFELKTYFPMEKKKSRWSLGQSTENI